MALSSIKEPFANAAIRCTPGSPSLSPPRRTLYKSKALAALDAHPNLLDLNQPAKPKSRAAPYRSFAASKVERASAASPVDLEPPFFMSNPATSLATDENSHATIARVTNALQDVQAIMQRSKAEDAQVQKIVHAKKRKPRVFEPENPLGLPNYSYKDFKPAPAVVYTRDEAEADDLLQCLKGPLGFDMEWRVFWTRGPKMAERKTALVQVCDENMILLVQVSSMKRFPPRLKAIIESDKIVKTGANIKNDGEKLSRDFGIRAAGLVELGGLARERDPKFPYNRTIVSLAKMTALYTGKHLVKDHERISNWEQELTPQQRMYASNDVHSGLMVYKRVMALEQLQPDPDASSSKTTGPDKSEDIMETVEQEQVDATPAPKAISVDAATEYVSHPGVRPQHMRAYRLWHEKQESLQTICAELRSKENPLKESTVISYVVGALQADTSLPFSLERLKALAQLEAGSWSRHRQFIKSVSARTT